jgi:hypothetical protein
MCRKLYEYSEFGKADNKLELMSNILLRHNMLNILLKHIINMFCKNFSLSTYSHAAQAMHKISRERKG